MTNILITGGLGYIGGRIANYLRQNRPDANVMLATRRAEINIPAWAKSFPVFHLDILNEAETDNCLKGVDVVIHLAALNEIESMNDPMMATEVNVKGTYNLLKHAELNKVGRFIYFSTFHVYGDIKGQKITEDIPAKSQHPYAITHRCAEDFVRFFRRYRNMETLILRLSNGYGYPMDRDVNRWTLIFNDLCKQAVLTKKIVLKSSGRQHRDFIAMQDIARAVDHFVFQIPGGWGDGLYNLGGACSMSMLDVARKVEDIYRLRYHKDVVKIETMPDGGEEKPAEIVHYGIDKLFGTGFCLSGDMDTEISGTMKLCEQFLEDKTKEKTAGQIGREKIKLSRSCVGETEKRALSAVIDGAFLGMGSYVQSFEEKIGEYLSSDDVVCVNTGTAALHLALNALQLEPGDEVLVQSLTYIATFQAISAAGLIPVPCEVDPKTCTLDHKDAERKITKRTRVILPVHYASHMGDIDAIYSLARRYNLRVVEDAAHAFGTSYCGKKIGSFGDIICFSFDGIKSITCGEGGAVVTKNRLVAEHIKNARLLGVQKDTERRFAEERSWQFDVEYQGYRYHMSNLCAALGLTQLSRFDSYLKPRRQELAKRYNEKLSDVKGIELFEDEYNETVPHMFPIKVNGAMRDKLRDFLSENNIETGIHYYPNHLLTYYGKGKIKLPVTEDLYGRLLTLPLHPELSDNDIDYIADRIRDFYKK